METLLLLATTAAAHPLEKGNQQQQQQQQMPISAVNASVHQHVAPTAAPVKRLSEIVSFVTVSELFVRTYSSIIIITKAAASPTLQTKQNRKPVLHRRRAVETRTPFPLVFYLI